MNKQPYLVSEVICFNCGERWISARPYSVKLKEIKCERCSRTGYVVETGEIIRDDEDGQGTEAL